MKLLIIADNKIIQYALPEKIEESTLFTYVSSNDVESQLTIESIDNHWCLKSNGSIDVVDNGMTVLQKPLEDYGMYTLFVTGEKKYVKLVAMPSVEQETYLLNTTIIQNISIGSESTNNIIYKNQAVPAKLATIQYTNDGWFVNSLVQKDPVYVNDEAIITSRLKMGDVIFYNGLKIIWMQNFLKINNPKKSIGVSGMQVYQSPANYDNTKFDAIPPESTNVSQYQDDDYFQPLPRLTTGIKEQKIIIDPPPENQQHKELPLYLTIGTSLTMSMMSIIMLVNAFTNGNSSTISMVTSVLMAITMLASSLIFPRLTANYNKKQAAKREELRQTKYTQYLNEKLQEIQNTIKRQEQAMNDNYPSIAECSQMVLEKNKSNVNFWSRSVKDDDFVTVRLGVGNGIAKIDVSAPEKHFRLDDDNLLENVYKGVDRYKELSNVPILLDFKKYTMIGLFSNNSYRNQYVDGILLQLVATQSPVNLKIVVFTDKQHEKRWNYIKYLPHCWSNDKSTCYFASSSEEINEVSNFLDGEYKIRKKSIGKKTDDVNKKNQETEISEEKEQEDAYKNFTPYYIIINDDYKVAKNTSILDDMLKISDNLGFSFLFIARTMRYLPSECQVFLDIDEKNGHILEKQNETADTVMNEKYQVFSNEYNLNLDMRRVSTALANIPIVTSGGIDELPNVLPMLEMYGVSKIEQLNITNRWKTNNPISSLAAPVGVHKNGDLFKLDLHEKFHGPHGLVAGMTGSGKSEFIITYILSMAINYHPYEVQFVLIDYKGGGLAGAFENKETGVKLPHLIGSITNLDTSEMNRSLVSIESELKRRQKVFNQVKDKTGESTIDIYKYQKLYREGVVKEPMAHLFIISDEFAELKTQQPDFMNELVSTARIGRSLGVHLILATQKPAGVVNDQIWSNSKFKVCLKVQDRSDSMEMLKRPEAASIKETGRFYLQVGYNDLFDIGQSAWSGAKYVPSDIVLKKTDTSVSFVNNIGAVIKSVNDIIKQDKSKDYGDQLTNIVKYIYEIGKKENIETKQLWLESLPADIYLSDLRKKYNYKPIPSLVNPIIGEFDLPSKQTQGLLNLDLTHEGNTLIYGQSGSGKENLLATILFSIVSENTPSDVNIYIIDLGAETLQMFRKMPHVGGVLGIDDFDKIIDLFTMVDDEMTRRKELFSDYGGSFTTYNESNANKEPLIVIIINGYDNFSESFSRIEDGIQNFIRDGAKYGVVFIVTTITASAVRGRMLQYFNHKIVMQMTDAYAFRDILGAPRGFSIAKVFGRGALKHDGNVCEFQSAFIYDRKLINEVVRKSTEELNKVYTTRAIKIPTIPDIVSVNEFLNESVQLSALPIGYSLNTKSIYTYDFTKNHFTPILFNDIRAGIPFVRAIIKEMKIVKDTSMQLIDFAHILEVPIPDINCTNSDFDDEIAKIKNEIDSNLDQTLIYFLLGMGNIRNVLNANSIATINTLMMNTMKSGSAYFIVVDNYQGYKQLQLEQWFQVQVNSAYGIWVGEGFDNQTSIRINNLSAQDRQNKYPYMALPVVNGQHEFIKYVTDEVPKEVNSNEK